MKKCLTLLIATVLSGISLTAYAAQPMINWQKKRANKARKVMSLIPQAEMTRCSVLQPSTNNPTNVTAFASGCSFRLFCNQKNIKYELNVNKCISFSRNG